MLYNGAIGKGTALADYFRVLYHGASLDAATAGYLTAIPWLVILISFWLKRVPLRKILGGYYLLIALIVSCIGIADMSLYPFWGFKLDASIFQYLDSPKNAMASVSAGFIALRIVFILILAALLSLWWFAVTPKNWKRHVSVWQAPALPYCWEVYCSSSSGAESPNRPPISDRPISATTNF